MWLKLLKPKSNIAEMIQPKFVNGKWRRAEISGRQKAELQKYFRQAGLPWIYEQPRPFIHANSVYNKRPKGTKFEQNEEQRLATIRKNLSTQEEKLEKLRQERLDNKPLMGIEKILAQAAKGVLMDSESGNQQQQQRSASAKRAEAAAQKAQDAEIGIGVRKSATKKSKVGASRGGLINKKMKVSFDLSGQSIKDAEQGIGKATSTVKDMQQKPDKAT